MEVSGIIFRTFLSTLTSEGSNHYRIAFLLPSPDSTRSTVRLLNLFSPALYLTHVLLDLYAPRNISYLSACCLTRFAILIVTDILYYLINRNCKDISILVDRRGGASATPDARDAFPPFASISDSGAGFRSLSTLTEADLGDVQGSGCNHLHPA